MKLGIDTRTLACASGLVDHSAMVVRDRMRTKLFQPDLISPKVSSGVACSIPG
jgi:hypothetical protein